MEKHAVLWASLSIALILVVGFFFIAKAADGLHQEKVRYLEEISLKSADSVKQQIEGYFSTVEAIATIIGSTPTFDSEIAIQILKKENEEKFFRRMGFVQSDGITTTTDGRIFDINDREYFQLAMQGEQVASDCLVDKVDGEEINVFATPVYHSDKIEGVIFATQTQESLSKALAINSFGGQGYSYIITSDGRPVVGTTHPGSVGEYTNLFASLAEHGLSAQNMAAMQADIAEGKSGAMESLRGDSKQHFCYVPVGISDWYIISVVPAAIISKQSDQLIRNLSFLLALMVLLTIIISSRMIFFFQHNNRQLAHVAYTDTITGYKNWAKFQLDASEVLQCSRDKQFAIITVDINKFKVINDMFGYNRGNDILKFVADVIERHLGYNETFCRSASDNFSILMEYESDMKLLSRMEQMSAEIEKYIVNYKIKVSIGIYVVDETTIDVSLLCDKANISRGIAKKSNQDINYHFFRDENRQEILHEKEIENLMDDALKNHEFEVYLQPKYLSVSDNIVGAEALVRWNRAGVGLVPPCDFIPLFEKNGFIRKLDFYMFESVCRLLADWHLRFPHMSPIGVSVNLSRTQLSRGSLPHDLLEIANRHGVSPGMIEIELTESAIFENVAEMKKVMWKIKEAGFLISIDDFGSGYSSLASLKYLPADFVKMDKSFLDEAENDKRGEKIISSMIVMIKSLGMGTVAEGVETRSQLDFLKSAGCDIVQGYYWARPMKIADFEQLAYGEEV